MAQTHDGAFLHLRLAGPAQAPVSRRGRQDAALGSSQAPWLDAAEQVRTGRGAGLLRCGI